jgi:hypothetical protein
MYTHSVPLQVDIALECARLQHRFSLPPLEVDDFPQAGFTDFRMSQSTPIRENANETDILQEILSVAQASQELINHSNIPDTWGGNYAPDDDFSFMVGTRDHTRNIQVSDMNAERYWEDPSTRSIHIGDLDEDFKTERMAENLRWVGMSDKDLEKVPLIF